MENIVAKILEVISIFGLKFIAALATFFIGRFAAGLLNNFLRRLMQKGNVDPTLTSFLGHLIYISLLTFVVLAALKNDLTRRIYPFLSPQRDVHLYEHKNL